MVGGLINFFIEKDVLVTKAETLAIKATIISVDGVKIERLSFPSLDDSLVKKYLHLLKSGKFKDERFELFLQEVHHYLVGKAPRTIRQFDEAYAVLEKSFSQNRQLLNYDDFLLLAIFSDTLYFEIGHLEDKILGVGVYYFAYKLVS